jgi:hypothetical protein
MLITTSIFVMKEYFNTLQKEMEGKKKTNVKLEKIKKAKDITSGTYVYNFHFKHKSNAVIQEQRSNNEFLYNMLHKIKLDHLPPIATIYCTGGVSIYAPFTKPYIVFSAFSLSAKIFANTGFFFLGSVV